MIRITDESLKRDIAIVLILIITIIGASLISKVIDFNAIRETILSFGILAPLALIFFMFLGIVISPIPSVPLAIMSGTLFGGFLGGVYAVLGGFLGAIAAFMIARKLGKEFMEKRFRNIMKVYDSLTDKNLFLIIMISRTLPIFNFDLISYAAGLTNIKLWEFALATFIGMIPLAFIFSYSGNYFALADVWLSISISVLLIMLLYLIPKYIIKHRRARRRRNEAVSTSST